MSNAKETKVAKTPMTPEAASRIQSSADKSGTNQDFKERAQSAASKTGGAQGKPRK